MDKQLTEFEKSVRAMIWGHIHLNYKEIEDIKPIDDIELQVISKKLLSTAREQIKSEIDLLLDSIDHAYLNPDGTYNDLALEVVDKVKYLKSIRCKQ